MLSGWGDGWLEKGKYFHGGTSAHPQRRRSAWLKWSEPQLRVSNVLLEAEDLRRFAGKSQFSPAAENAVVGFLA